MYCPNCGRKVDQIETTKFCPNCGADLETGLKHKPDKKPLTKNQAIFIIGLLFVIFVAAAVMIAVNGNRTIQVTDDELKDAIYQQIINENNGTTTPSTPVPADTQPAPTEPATTNTSSNEIDPDFYEEGFWIYDLKEACATNVFNFVDTWKGKRILVDGTVGSMSYSYDGSRYINLYPYDYSSQTFDYDFNILCYLEGDGGNLTQYLGEKDYCSLTGEINPNFCNSDHLTLEHCYVYSVE